METKFKVGMECLWLDAFPALVFAIEPDLVDGNSIFVRVQYSNGWRVERVNEKGCTEQYGDRVVLTPAPCKVKVSGWVNVYERGSITWMGSPKESKKEAADCAEGLAIACKYIEFEVTEGEGLEAAHG